MTRYHVFTEGEEHQGLLVEHGALRLPTRSIPVTVAFDHQKIIGEADYFRRDADGRISAEIAFAHPEQIESDSYSLDMKMLAGEHLNDNLIAKVTAAEITGVTYLGPHNRPPAKPTKHVLEQYMLEILYKVVPTFPPVYMWRCEDCDTWTSAYSSSTASNVLDRALNHLTKVHPEIDRIHILYKKEKA